MTGATYTFPRPLTRRHARIVQLLEDHAPRFHRITPGDEARYVLESYVKDATREEWDAAYAYVAEHPDLFTSPHLTPEQIAERDRANAMNCEAESLRAFLNGDYATALRFIDDAEWWLPAEASSWNGRRRSILRQEARAQ